VFFDNARTFFMRFIFGAAEAGFAPGIILYLTYWFTAEERARWVGVVITALPLSSVIGGPISGFVLDTLDGSMGLGGWQWLFLIQGVPSVLVGFWALAHLTDKPIEATWLDPDERIALQARIDHERKSREAIRHYKLGEALTNPRVLGLGLVFFGIVCGISGLVYWLPQIVKGVATDSGLDKLAGVSINALTGYLVAVPFAFAIAAMVWGFPDRRAACAPARPALPASGPHHLRDRSACGPAHLLDLADRLSHRFRGRWRLRIDKFDQQSWRLCHRLDQGCDRRNNAWPCGAGGRSDYSRRRDIADGAQLENGDGGKPHDGEVSPG
jgi:MFS family permease